MAYENNQLANAERRLLSRNPVSTTAYLSVRGQGVRRCRATNLSALGVYLEIERLGLPPGTVVSLIFAVKLGTVTRLHRKKAVIAHATERGVGLMMQGRLRRA